jgi:uncharacterized membrane protein YidH (DUF202 family)
MGSGRTFLGVVLLVIALVAIAAGIVYFTMSAHNLPSFMPGHLSSVAATGHRTKRGIICVAVGVVLLIVSVAVLATGRRRYRY